jgi:riboflavin biosynthesis pyrimidine reductase
VGTYRCSLGGELLTRWESAHSARGAWWDGAVRRLFPDPPAELDDEALAAAYALPPETARHVRMNFVASVDGAATVGDKSRGLATSGDTRVFDLLRELCDVVLVGAGTVRVEGYLQPAYPPDRRARRLGRGLAEVPPYAVVSHSLLLDPTSPLFTAAVPRTIVVTRAGAPADRREALAQVADVVVAGTEQVDLAAALDQLADRGLRRVLCEGGPHLFGALLAANLVDELCLTVSPLLAGPGSVRIVAGQPRPDQTWPQPQLDRTWPLALRQLLTEDGALLLRYQVDRP